MSNADEVFKKENGKKTDFISNRFSSSFHAWESRRQLLAMTVQLLETVARGCQLGTFGSLFTRGRVSVGAKPLRWSRGDFRECVASELFLWNRFFFLW